MRALGTAATANRLVLVAGLGSLAVLLGAFGFQYLGGLVPCKLCIWQRWPHGIAFVLALAAFWRPWRPIMALGALVVLFGAGVAVYHVGVEQHWWLGPTTCSSQPVNGISTEDLMDRIMTAPLVRCDDIQWSLFGLSMAAWNALASLGYAALWLAAATRLRAK